jgi:hypothetical protein
MQITCQYDFGFTPGTRAPRLVNIVSLFVPTTKFQLTASLDAAVPQTNQ